MDVPYDNNNFLAILNADNSGNSFNLGTLIVNSNAMPSFVGFLYINGTPITST